LKLNVCELGIKTRRMGLSEPAITIHRRGKRLRLILKSHRNGISISDLVADTNKKENFGRYRYQPLKR
jgi:hypothetical protein